MRRLALSMLAVGLGLLCTFAGRARAAAQAVQPTTLSAYTYPLDRTSLADACLEPELVALNELLAPILGALPAEASSLAAVREGLQRAYAGTGVRVWEESNGRSYRRQLRPGQDWMNLECLASTIHVQHGTDKPLVVELEVLKSMDGSSFQSAPLFSGAKYLVGRTFPLDCNGLPEFFRDPAFVELHGHLGGVPALPAETGSLAKAQAYLEQAYAGSETGVTEQANGVLYKWVYNPKTGRYYWACCEVGFLHVGDPEAKPTVVQLEVMTVLETPGE